MRTAAELIRSRVDTIARILTTEQGKPLSEAKSEILNGADVID
jgi:succinate-semialdehyde dehydrogenase/glutarate-semialdehyde dehydrogenase